MLRKFLILTTTILLNIPTLTQYKTQGILDNPIEFNDETITDILDKNGEEINVGFWALIIAKEFDNDIDVKHYLKTLDDIAEEINKMLAGRKKDMDKFLAVKTFLYEPGIWNNYNPFSYDLDDPLGKQLENQLISSYLETRKGNCVSMPTLFLALMERIDPSIEFYGIKAPLHLFCRFNDRQTGDVWNVETTNGGNPARNQWYIETMNINQTAVDKGIYLEDLTKKEYIAELLTTLIAKERRNGNFKKALKYAELVLKLNPKSVLGLVNKGALLAEIGQQKLDRDILTREEKDYYEEESVKFIEKAKTLGWEPQTEEERDEYLKNVKEEKQKYNLEKK